MTPVVDVHVHVFSAEVIRNRERYLEKDEWFRALYADPKSRMVTYEQVIREMDECGVDHSIVFGFAYKDQSLCREANDYVLEAVKGHPDRLTGFACVSPDQPGAEAELERALDAGFAGCGELFPDGQGFETDSSAGLDRVAGVLTERGLPVNIHANEPVGHDYPGKGDNGPGPCYRFAAKHPDLTIVYAHMAGGLFIYELMAEAKRVLRRVYYDTSAAPFLYGRDVYSISAIAAGPEKILFGSDFPLISPRRYLEETKDMDPAVRAAILGGNAIEALGLRVAPRRRGAGGPVDQSDAQGAAGQREARG